MSASDEGVPLPAEVTQRIPHRDASVLRFFLGFLQARQLENVPLLIAGGYVRDLLLHRRPDDLDIALCLRDVADVELRVEDLVEAMPAFADAAPQFHVSDVHIVTIRSDETKSKLLDTVKLHMVVSPRGGGDGEERFEVDVMPTIGEESYDDDSRIPTRNQRGSIKEDALRRDLTIGALLLRVQYAAEAAQNELEYRLIDYYGGVEDLRHAVLRSPYPRDADCRQLYGMIVQPNPTAERMAHALALLPESWSDKEALAQRLWWIKVLVEDPLRVVRVLRFAAKLNFTLHDAFWDVVPFAVEKLRDMVAGSRKLTEILKIANYSSQKLRAFVRMAFVRRIPIIGTIYEGAIGGATDFQDGVLAPALFGGQDAKGLAHSLPNIAAFDEDGFLKICSDLDDFLRALNGMPQEEQEQGREGGTASDLSQAVATWSAEESLGLCLCTAVVVSSWPAKGVDPLSLCQASLDSFSQCCDGLSSSNVTRYAGDHTLRASLHILSVVLGVTERCSAEDEAFGALAGLSAADFALHVHVWNALRMAKMPLPGASNVAGAPDPTLGGRATLSLASCAYFLRVAGQAQSADTPRRSTVKRNGSAKADGSAQADGSAKADGGVESEGGIESEGGLETEMLYSVYSRLLRGKPSISGKALGGTDVVPEHLRSGFISRLQVLTRLLDYGTDIESAAELRRFLEGAKQDGVGLEERLRLVWWHEAEGEWRLKPEFDRPKGGRKRNSQTSKKQKRDKGKRSS